MAYQFRTKNALSSIARPGKSEWKMEERSGLSSLKRACTPFGAQHARDVNNRRTLMGILLWARRTFVFIRPLTAFVISGSAYERF